MFFKNLACVNFLTNSMSGCSYVVKTGYQMVEVNIYDDYIFIITMFYIYPSFLSSIHDRLGIQESPFDKRDSHDLVELFILQSYSVSILIMLRFVGPQWNADSSFLCSATEPIETFLKTLLHCEPTKMSFMHTFYCPLYFPHFVFTFATHKYWLIFPNAT